MQQQGEHGHSGSRGTLPAGASGEADPERFHVEIRPERAWVRVLAIGEIDLATASLLEDCLLELLEVGFDGLRLDLSRVSFLDCAGLRVLHGVGSCARRTAVRFEVLHASGQVARLLALA